MRSKITLTLICVLFLGILVSCNSKNKNNSTSETTVISNENADSFTSKMTKSDKKKYFDGSNNVVYEIKYKPDGFKLRTASSTLLWKIKLYDDKIKISDNEENMNPYEIKLTEANKAKLVKNDATIARTSYNLESKQQSVASVNDGQPEFFKTSYSPSLLVNSIPEISASQKQILIKELKAKGY